MVNFVDIFKKKFIDISSTQDLSIERIVISLLVALICGLIIFYVYQKFYRGVIYSHNFNTLLIMVCIITAFIIMTISSNIVLSLGMVGALSIVRFRTAIKEPLDIGFLFWSVAAGITAGAGLYPLAIIGTIFIAVLYVLLSLFRNKTKVYLLIINYNTEVADKVNEIIGKMKYILKNKTSTGDKTELTLELRIKGDNTAFVGQLSSISGVQSAVLVQYCGDYGE